MNQTPPHKDIPLKISKLDASKRQLEIAIRLYFYSDDPISIHTLTAAAYNVIRDLNSKNERSPMFMKDLFLDYIIENKKKEIQKMINEAENFFKHADKDPEKILDFNTQLTEIMIWDACEHYTAITGESPPLFKIFLAWYYLQHPDYIKKEHPMVKEWFERSSDFKNYSKADFFIKMLPIVNKIS